MECAFISWSSLDKVLPMAKIWASGLLDIWFTALVWSLLTSLWCTNLIISLDGVKLSAWWWYSVTLLYTSLRILYHSSHKSTWFMIQHSCNQLSGLPSFSFPYKQHPSKCSWADSENSLLQLRMDHPQNQRKIASWLIKVSKNFLLSEKMDQSTVFMTINENSKEGQTQASGKHDLK